MSRIGHTTQRHPTCPECGYDLVATVDAGRNVCPECGYEFGPQDLVREVRPGDWTPARGYKRAAVVLAVRGIFCLLGWIGVLYGSHALMRAIWPGLGTTGRLLMLALVGATSMIAGGVIGHVLSRRMDEIAGLSGVLLVAVVSLIAWIVLIVGTIVATILAGISIGDLAGAAICAAFIATIIIVRSHLIEQF
jgi:hypothetical protein